MSNRATYNFQGIMYKHWFNLRITVFLDIYSTFIYDKLDDF